MAVLCDFSRKKALTKGGKGDILSKSLTRGGRKGKHKKLFKKSSKKCLTNERQRDIMVKLSPQKKSDSQARRKPRRGLLGSPKDFLGKGETVGKDEVALATEERDGFRRDV